MSNVPKYLVVMSFDGLSSHDFDYISNLPNFSRFLEQASYCKNVYSIYPSLTYPAHTTIITGKYPKNHGVVNNTLFQPERESPDWYWLRNHVKGDTLYDAAIRKGMKTAALLWPVTGRSDIQYNMPEIFANRPWQNQIMVSLRNGSPFFQLELNKKFGHLRDGKKQPELDNFVHQSLLYTIVNKRPELILVHYTDLDTMRHHYGFNSGQARMSLHRHDERLGDVIKVLKDNGIYEDAAVVVLGDHSSLDEEKVINLNVLLRTNGYIDVDDSGAIKDYRAIAKHCDGSAYLYIKGNRSLRDKVRKLLEIFNKQNNCIEVIYTAEEAATLGADPECDFMLEANLGYYFLDGVEGDAIRQIQRGEAGRVPHITASTHGYSPLKPGYTTVFMAAGKGIKKNTVIDNMCLIDEGPTMAALLGLELEGADGRVLKEVLE